MKKTTDLSGTSKGYKVFSVAILVVMVIFFLFPLYWIVTGSVKEKTDIIIKAGESVKWIPTTISWDTPLIEKGVTG